MKGEDNKEEQRKMKRGPAATEKMEICGKI